MTQREYLASVFMQTLIRNEPMSFFAQPEVIDDMAEQAVRMADALETALKKESIRDRNIDRFSDDDLPTRDQDHQILEERLPL